MMGLINKADRLDARGLNTLQRNRTLPIAWIPPDELRALPPTRLVLVQQRRRWKKRITATLSKHGVSASEAGDPYEKGARQELGQRIGQLPAHGRWGHDPALRDRGMNATHLRYIFMPSEGEEMTAHYPSPSFPLVGWQARSHLHYS